MKFWIWFKYVVLVLVLPLLLAVFVSSPDGRFREITPAKSPRALFQGIARDGWVTDGASISLSGYFPRGNKALLEFDHWRPLGAPPANLRLSICGEQIAEFSVTKESIRFPISLDGSCEERKLSFDVLNPVEVPGSDDRALGAKLLRMFVFTNFITLPIASAFSIAKAYFFILFLGLFFWSVLKIWSPRFTQDFEDSELKNDS